MFLPTKMHSIRDQNSGSYNSTLLDKLTIQVKKKVTTEAFKLTIHMVSSLDGIIAKKDNSISWFDTTDKYEKGITVSKEEAATFLETIDCYVMGSRTYEHALEISKSFGWAYGDKHTFVLTSRHLPVERSTVEFYSGDLENLVNERLKPNYRSVWVVGGASLANNLIRLKLADELRLTIMPIILGEGTSFFDRSGLQQALHLTDVTAYKNGSIELFYEICKG